MSVEIEPAELGFRRPFTREVAEVLRLRNPNNNPVAFKVKTTAPKQYCVRPNSGRIEPGQQVEVSVLLQAMKQDLPLDAKCRDKFLVQSVPIPADYLFSTVSAIWEYVLKSDPSAIQEKKIRVVFLPPDGTGTATLTPNRQMVNGSDHATPDVAPPAYSPEVTALNGGAGNETIMETPQAQRDEASVSGKPVPVDPSEADTEDASVFTTTTAQQAPPTVITTPPSTIEQEKPKSKSEETPAELKTKLARAEALIAELRAQATQGLRQRKAGAGGSDDAGTSAAGQLATAAVGPRQGTEGVPVQIAAILCLVSFLLAYLFF